MPTLLSRSLADNADGSDSLARGTATHARSLADNAASSEALARIGRNPRALADNDAMADSLASGLGTHSRTLADGDAGSDALARGAAAHSRSLADGDALADSLGLPAIAIVGATVAIVLAAPTGSLTVSSAPAPTPTPMGPSILYEMFVVDHTGSRLATLTKFDIARLGWVHLDAGEMEFSLSATDSQVASVKKLEREVQVYRNGTLLWWGVPTRITAAHDKVTYLCRELLWYFKRRVFGCTGLADYMQDGSFEADTVGSPPNPAFWFSSPDFIAGGASGVVNNNDFIGTHAVQLNYGTAGKDSFIGSALISVPKKAIGVPFILTAHVWVSNTHWVGTATQARGLYVELIDADNKFVTNAIVPIDDNTPRDQWVTMQTLIGIPANATTSWKLQVRLYAPATWVVWDGVTLHLPESNTYTNKDAADIIHDLVDRAQGRGGDPGHTDLNIWYAGAPTGQLFTRSFQWIEHGTFYDAMKELADQPNGPEFIIDLTNRALTVSPTVGTVRGDITLEFGVNLSGYAVQEDGENAFNVVIIEGEGEREGRIEYGASDLSKLGGVSYEMVDRAPQGAGANTVSQLASSELVRRGNGQIIPTVTTHEGAGPVIGNLKCGDTVPVVIASGSYSYSQSCRVVRMDLDPKKDSLTVTLNEVPA